MVCHNDALCNLPPEYYGCPAACTGPNADQKHGCPDCEVTILFEQMLEEIDLELNKLRERKGYGPKHKWQWTVKSLMRSVNNASALDASVSGKGYPGDWTVPISRAVSVVRQEKLNLSMAESYTRRLEAEARARAGGN